MFWIPAFAGITPCNLSALWYQFVRRTSGCSDSDAGNRSCLFDPIIVSRLPSKQGSGQCGRQWFLKCEEKAYSWCFQTAGWTPFRSSLQGARVSGAWYLYPSLCGSFWLEWEGLLLWRPSMSQPVVSPHGWPWSNRNQHEAIVRNWEI